MSKWTPPPRPTPQLKPTGYFRTPEYWRAIKQVAEAIWNRKTRKP